jgi:hypothetical protein
VEVQTLRDSLHDRREDVEVDLERRDLEADVLELVDGDLRHHPLR